MDILAGSDSDSEKKDTGFKINKSYAKTYEKFRKREEKQRLLDKYGDPNASESEEEEIRSTQALDKEWLRAFAVVRFQQARLYSGEKLFNEEVKPVPKKSEEKKFTLKDQERKYLLEKGGVVSDDEDDVGRQKKAGPSYFEEQEEIRRSLKKAINDQSDDDNEEDSLLVVKEKTKQETTQEENEYLSWLKGERKELKDKDASKELAPLKAYWSNPNLAHKEKILRDYILNNGYMAEERDESSSDDEDGDSIDLSEDEEFLDRAAKYEKTFNFRHEEPGGCEMKSYPRVIETSVRVKAENKRAERRKRLAEKKQREKEERMEELKMLQKLQREEKEEKLRKLEELSENPNIVKYLETDFDPEEHDTLMKKHYDDAYYKEDGEEEKPVFEDDDEEMNDGTFGDDADDWWHQREQAQEHEIAEDGTGPGEGEEELYADDPGFVMDADYDPNAAAAKKSKKEKKNSKKKKKKEDKPLYDPTTKTFDEYLEEYVKDKINRLPFTYREVVPIDFGLSTNEILTADDKELNTWVSVKRMSQYRSKESEMYDLKKYQRKAKNQRKKLQAIPSLDPKQRAVEASDISRPPAVKWQRIEDQDVLKDSKTKKGSKSDANKSSEVKTKKDKKRGRDNLHDEHGTNVGESPEPKKKKKNKEKRGHEESGENDKVVNSKEDSDELSEPKKKKKNKRKCGHEESGENDKVMNSIEDSEELSEPKRKKKKKDKAQLVVNEDIVKSADKNQTLESDASSKLKEKKGKSSKDNGILSNSLQEESFDCSQGTKHKKRSKKRKHNVLDDSSTEISHEKTPTPKKKKKLQDNEETKHSNVQWKSGKGKRKNKEPVEHKDKQYRKNFSNMRVDAYDPKDAKPSWNDKREANRNLRLVMSKSRLSSFGLNKAKKKKQSDEQHTQD